MADIIIGDEDNFGKKGVIVKVIDESTLPTSAEGYKAYPAAETYSNIYPDLCKDFKGEELNDQIFNRMFNPSIDGSKALPKKWELKGYRQTLISSKHHGEETDVVIRDISEDYVYGAKPLNAQIQSRGKHRQQPRKDVGGGKSLNQLIVEYVENQAKRELRWPIGEISLTEKCNTHQAIIKDIVINKFNPNDTIIE